MFCVILNMWRKMYFSIATTIFGSIRTLLVLAVLANLICVSFRYYLIHLHLISKQNFISMPFTVVLACRRSNYFLVRKQFIWKCFRFVMDGDSHRNKNVNNNKRKRGAHIYTKHSRKTNHHKNHRKRLRIL